MAADSSFRPALIIVDLQEDFCPPNGSLAVPNGRSVIPTINSLLTLPFALKICTKDWHPPDHISFASNHKNKDPFTDFATVTHPSDDSRSYSTRLWPVHCVQNTPGAQLVSELDVSKVDVVIEKGLSKETEMYSAFKDPFKWQVSGLKGKLIENGISDIFVVGLAGDYCVQDTAKDAAEEGWQGRTWVVEEGVKSVDPSSWESVIEELKGKGVSVVKFESVEVRKVRALSEN